MTHVVPARSRGLAALFLTITVSLGMSGCGSDTDPVVADDPTSSPSPTGSATQSPSGNAKSPSKSPTEEGQVIDITITGDSVAPNGERVEATVGEEIILRVAAEQPGELHVHATPEVELPYPAGTTDLPLTIEQPGVVEVESHDLGLVVIQLEVR